MLNIFQIRVEHLFDYMLNIFQMHIEENNIQVEICKI